MKAVLLSRLQAFGQEHLLAFWDDLDDAARQQLTREIDQLDFGLIAGLMDGVEAVPDWAELAARARPPKAVRLQGTNPYSAEEASARGQRALRAGEVGMILVAGGQGTRLGFGHPKGMFRLGPVSDRSLFQILIERLLAVAGRYGVRIPLYLMTSPATHDETLEFLDDHGRFGLPRQALRVFCQGVMPAVDAATGKVLLADRGRLFLSPDGHGGMLAALAESGCLADAEQRGIRHLFYCQVDNPLSQVCDPLLIGYHLLAKSEMTTQVVRKVDPLEKVGNVVEIDGRTRIIEYIDLPEQHARQRGEDGALRLWAGNMAVHVFDAGFLEGALGQTDALPFHRAFKKAAYLGEHGRRIEPTEPNAVKFERFIFDLLPHARNAIVVEAAKEEAFAPVKNSDGAAADTPAAARAAMLRQHAAMLLAAGARVDANVPVEINPLWALDADDLAQKIEPGLRVSEPTYFH